MNRVDPSGLTCTATTGTHICTTDTYNRRPVQRDKNGAPRIYTKTARNRSVRDSKAEAKVSRLDASMTKSYGTIKSNPDAKYSQALNGEGYPESGLKLEFTGAELAKIAEDTEVNAETVNTPKESNVGGDTNAAGHVNLYVDRLRTDAIRQDAATHEWIHNTPIAADFVRIKGVEGFPEHQKFFDNLVKQVLGN